MLDSTLRYLKCPSQEGECPGELTLHATKKIPYAPGVNEIQSGDLICKECRGKFPILAGVAVLLPEVKDYLITHVKGISRWVEEDEIPSRYRGAFLKAKREIFSEHIEEDLESERVNALYLMNHYLSVQGNSTWWNSSASESSPIMDKLIREYWDQGPFTKIEEFIHSRFSGKAPSFVELGCGVGGLRTKLGSRLGNYLGVDSSFASIAWARQILLTKTGSFKFKIPEDLLNGVVSRDVVASLPDLKGNSDFLVCDVQHPPLKSGEWDITASLNMIDMLDDPVSLPTLQQRLLKDKGIAIQSCPYIWHPEVAQNLRQILPESIQDSALAIEWIYQGIGFEIEKKILHSPWLFFKHLRQLEIYSVHLFFASK